MPKTKQRRKYTPRAPAIPNYLRHKATGQGYARVNGRQIYFGDYDEPESRQRYDAAIARYLANNRTLPGAQADLTIVELCADYLRFAEGYYGNSSTMTWVREAIRILRRLYGSSPCPYRKLHPVFVTRSSYASERRIVDFGFRFMQGR